MLTDGSITDHIKSRSDKRVTCIADVLSEVLR